MVASADRKNRFVMPSTTLLSSCEDLWRGWLEDKLVLPPFMEETFDLDAAPEPYVSFDAAHNPLVVLTTNPGRTMAHQRRSAIQAGIGPLRAIDDYATAARALGTFYAQTLRVAAGRRIAALRHLSSMLGLDGVLQVENVPISQPDSLEEVAIARCN